MDNKTFVELVTRYRKNNKLTYTQMQERTGVSRDSFRRWEKGEQQPKQEVVKHLVALLKLEEEQDVLAVTTPVTQLVSPPKPAKKPELVNHIALLLDNSGSMSFLRDVAQNAFNKILGSIRENAAKTGQRTYVSVYTFGEKIKRVSYDLPAHMVSDIEQYMPNEGYTRLFDAVDSALNDFAVIDRETNFEHSFLMIAVTDGQDNRQVNTTPRLLTQRMADFQKLDRYTLTFQTPRDGARTLEMFGVPSGNISVWEQTTKGVESVTQNTTFAMNSYYGSRSVGLRATKNFFSPDLSKLDATTLASACKDITGDVKTWTVDKEQDVLTFALAKTKQPLVKGTIFYQLMKTEKEVQDYKQLIVQDKATGHFYGGSDARRVIGLPTTGTVQIKPGNHANFDIFIQSTSSNRILPRGTKVVYWSRAV